MIYFDKNHLTMKAYIFDAFGTLFNLDKSVIGNVDNPHVPDILAYARTKQLSYTWLHSLMNKYVPFDEITKTALTDGCKKYGVADAVVEQLMPLYFEPTTFEDVLPTLKGLQAMQSVTGILSNGTRNMLQRGIAKNGMTEYINHVFSVDDIAKFKPDPAVYKMVTDKLGLDPSEVMFISSNQWDAAGAANFGFEVSWINRSNSFREAITYQDNIKELNALTDLLS